MAPTRSRYAHARANSRTVAPLQLLQPSDAPGSEAEEKDGRVAGSACLDCPGITQPLPTPATQDDGPYGLVDICLEYQLSGE
jgi:hypothetical protein